ncbi:unnamed protein product [Oikopleura dioica]|uniref:Uncharacterized protein n=1 Tax=Oikopleura dioica TaxID=34765 RepID=E4XA78_OIKDI|nr:unnamed protein product [Oikopleura dioica]
MAELEETHRELMETTKTHLLEIFQNRSGNESLIQAFESCRNNLRMQIDKKQNDLEKVQARLDERKEKRKRIYELSNKVFGIFNKANGLDSEKMELALKKEAAKQCFLMPSRKNKRLRLELLSFFEDEESGVENKKLKYAAPSSGEENLVQDNNMKDDSENSKINVAVDFSEMAAQYYEALSRGNGSLVQYVDEEIQTIQKRHNDSVKQEVDRESSSESNEEYSSDEVSEDVKQELRSENASGDEKGESSEEDSSEDEKTVDKALVKVEPNKEIFRLLYSGDSSSSEDEEPLNVKTEIEENEDIMQTGDG